MWAVWHLVVAVNSWRVRFARNPIDISCRVCHSSQEENYLHRFYSCSQAKIVWSYGFTIVRKLSRTRHNFLSLRGCVYDYRSYRQHAKVLLGVLFGIFYGIFFQ